MITHDPRQAIEDLRNHLAAHDRHLVFLFGAGTSSAINIAPPPGAGQKLKHEPLIPGIDGLTNICAKAVSALGEKQATAWKTLDNQCTQAKLVPNVENVLSSVRLKIDAVGEGESLLGLDREQLSEIERTIRAAVGKTVCPAEATIPKQTPHDDFAAWVAKVSRLAPLELFTTNYDILFERAFEAARVPVFDGFVGTFHPFFYPECVDDDNLLPGPKWVRIWKLHGSVSWHLEGGDAKRRITRTQPTESGEMILPSHWKYDESRKQPYIAFMDRLSRLLNSEHALLISCGYSFGDQHINAMLYEALDNRSTGNVIALQFHNLSENDDLTLAAARRSNLTVLGPNGGVVSGKWGSWQLTQPVDQKTASFMDTAFDSNALPEDQGSPAAKAADLQGRMRLGDFNWFCRFLKEMGPDLQ